jgi:hypothetical protein
MPFLKILLKWWNGLGSLKFGILESAFKNVLCCVMPFLKIPLKWWNGLGSLKLEDLGNLLSKICYAL